MKLLNSTAVLFLFYYVFGMGQTSHASACTRAFMNNHEGYMISARNLDYFDSVDPSLVISPRGEKRNGGSASNAAHWKSRYGSVALYANGIFAMDGLNEKGLAAHTLFYKNGSQAQSNNQDKPVLESQAWVSFLLDNFATVDEAVQTLRDNVRLVAKHMPIEYAADAKHIAMEDASGDSAIIEIDNGQVNIYHNRTYRVLTNNPGYPEMLKSLKRLEASRKDNVPGDLEADSRFVRATFYLKNLPKPDNKYEAQGFIQSVINNVAYPVNTPQSTDTKEVTDTYSKYNLYPEQEKGSATYWTTISDLSHLEYHFKSAFTSSQVWLSLQEIDFSEGQSLRKINHFNNYAINGWEGNLISKISTTTSLPPAAD
ncbi:linear amide C-N hydrolase [Brucella sp. HL-2]|nr:linear amide C-N hydrolase [Brucella sp. HL-2]MCV9910452.1 linear amide C-N hydrolase [Brucella sp. HL-2]